MSYLNTSTQGGRRAPRCNMYVEMLCEESTYCHFLSIVDSIVNADNAHWAEVAELLYHYLVLQQDGY